MKIAVIDLGTNTFNLLICEKMPDHTFRDVHRERVHVNLATQGVGMINPDAFQRAIDAMVHYAKKIEEHDVKKVRALATAAVRSASNGNELVKAILAKANIQVEVIDGDEEAKLIYEGVRLAYPLGADYELMMDIGGGSVEFIIANEKGLAWAQSFPIGVAVLRHLFHTEEPISSINTKALEDFLEEKLQPLFAILPTYKIKNLIGASGTFDVLENIFVVERKHPLHTFISVDDARDFYESIRYKDLQQRMAMPTVPNERASMIVVAMVLMLFAADRCKVQNIISAAYALKEGVMQGLVA